MLDLLARLEEILLAVIFLTMVVLFSGQVLILEIGEPILWLSARLHSVAPTLAQGVEWVGDHAILLARRLYWVDEATRYLMVWMVFLGLGLALARGKHVAMTSYLERFPRRTGRILRRVIDVVGLVFSLYIAWFGIDITRQVWASGQSSPTLGISNSILYLALPVGFALLALRYLASLFSLLDRSGPADPATGTGH
jgi:C4-dicarboxylate transporter DctQ subunit